MTAQFRKPQRLFSVYRIYFPSGCTILQAQRFLFCLRLEVFSMRNLWVSLVFILFIAVSVFRVVTTVYEHQWFLFCLSPYLFSEWHIVPQLYIQIKQSRVHSRKALYEWKASRRLGKQMRCFYRFLSKTHPTAPYIAVPKKRHSVLLFTVAKFAKFNYLI